MFIRNFTNNYKHFGGKFVKKKKLLLTKIKAREMVGWLQFKEYKYRGNDDISKMVGAFLP